MAAMGVALALVCGLTAAQPTRLHESLALGANKVGEVSTNSDVSLASTQTFCNGLAKCATDVEKKKEAKANGFSLLQISTASGVKGKVKTTKESMENSRLTLGNGCHKPRPKALFCFSLVRTPPEPTAALLARQLSAACDGWALFGDTEDPANNVTRGFAKQDIKKAWAHQMREVITEGVWKHLDESGALNVYEWFVMVETDSFVRPSTLRKTFRAMHTSCKRSLMSITEDDDKNRIQNHLEGFFVAVQADVAHNMKSLGWPKDCDAALSGHGDEWHHDVDAEIERCLREVNIPHIETLRDSQGHRLVASDQDSASSFGNKRRRRNTSEEKTGPKKCEHIADVLIERARLKIKGPLCECRPQEAPGPACVSEDFVTVHHVKDARTYSELVEAFP